MPREPLRQGADARVPVREPAQVPPAEIPGVNALLTLAVGVVVVAGLSLAREVLIPIVLAVLLSFLLAPLANLLQRLRLGRVLSAILAVLVALMVMSGVGGLIGAQVASLAGQASQYESTVEAKVSAVRKLTLGRLESLAQSVGQQIQRAGQPPQTGREPHTPTPAAPAQPPAAEAPGGKGGAQGGAQGLMDIKSPLAFVWRWAPPVVSPLGTLLIVFIFAVFILLQRDDLRDRMIRLAGSRDLHRTTMAMNDAARRLSRYFLTQLGVNAFFGLVTGLGLWAIGVPSPALWGTLGLLLRFVPYAGPWLAAAFPALLAAGVDPGWSMALWTVALYFGVEAILGQAVEPMLYGHSTGLSPFAVVVSATFWTWLWGPIGLILSTPLTLCLVVLGRHVDRLEFLDVLLGDRPALTPVESFYQRLLAGDADVAHEQAEVLLKEHSLSSYYDEVMLKGLQLAANDAMRGVMTEDQVARVKKTALQLVEDLEEESDTDPEPRRENEAPATPTAAERALPRRPAPKASAPARDVRRESWQAECPVLCLAGRGPIDDAAAAMLAQLLRKHGLGAAVREHTAADRENVFQLDITGVAMICVCYLELEGASAHLRYLVRRLRQRAPGVTLLVGLWPPVTERQMDERLRNTIGADLYASTMQEAVEACLEEVGGGAGAAETPQLPSAAA